jgi:hypothetical protein
MMSQQPIVPLQWFGLTLHNGSSPNTTSLRQAPIRQGLPCRPWVEYPRPTWSRATRKGPKTAEKSLHAGRGMSFPYHRPEAGQIRPLFLHGKLCMKHDSSVNESFAGKTVLCSPSHHTALPYRTNKSFYHIACAGCRAVSWGQSFACGEW